MLFNCLVEGEPLWIIVAKTRSISTSRALSSSGSSFFLFKPFRCVCKGMFKLCWASFMCEIFLTRWGEKIRKQTNMAKWVPFVLYWVRSVLAVHWIFLTYCVPFEYAAPFAFYFFISIRIQVVLRLLYGIVFCLLTTLRDAMIYDMSDSEPNNNLHLIACFFRPCNPKKSFIHFPCSGRRTFFF